MADDDWRIRIEVEEEEHATGLLDRLTGDLDQEARELARNLESHRLAVSRDGDTVFVYAATRATAEQAHLVVEAELRAHGIEARTSRVEHWIDAEDRWDDEPPGETWEEEELDRGFAPWEVRVECASREEADELAKQLETEGYKPERRFQYLIVGAASREDADALAARLHGDVEAGGEVVWETTPANPFAIFGGMGL
ncbi:MAG: SPOR domain-containing protein [Gaiellaceae bacterium]